MKIKFCIIQQLVGSAVLFLFVKAKKDEIRFDLRPENTTIVPGKPLVFNCSTTVASDDGIDWTFYSFQDSGRIVDQDPVYFVQRKGTGVEYRRPDCEVEEPDGRTSKLKIPFPNSSYAGKYCCQIQNGYGKVACAFAVFNDNSQLVTDATTYEGQTTGSTMNEGALTSATTDTSGLHTAVWVVLGVVIAVVVLVLIGVLLRYLLRKKRCHSQRDNKQSIQHQSEPLNTSSANR